MKSSESFKISNGFLTISNSYLKIKFRKGKYALDALKFFGSISLISLFIDKIKTYNELVNTYDFVLFWFFGLASIITIYFVIFYIFKEIWFQKIDLSDISKVEVYNDFDKKPVDEESKIEITLIKNNGRQKSIELKKQNNQLNHFLETLQKRNTRVKIEYI